MKEFPGREHGFYNRSVTSRKLIGTKIEHRTTNGRRKSA